MKRSSRKGVVEEKIPEIDVQVIEFPALKNERAQRVREQNLERKKKELEKDPAVESVDYNYAYTGSYTPRDSKFRFQWGFKKGGFEKAWHRTRGNGVRVAVVDSGTDIEHVFVNRNSTVEDLHGYGTHISGIVAARTGNGRGVAGGCPNCKLLVAKALDKIPGRLQRQHKRRYHLQRQKGCEGDQSLPGKPPRLCSPEERHKLRD